MKSIIRILVLGVITVIANVQAETYKIPGSVETDLSLGGTFVTAYMNVRYTPNKAGQFINIAYVSSPGLTVPYVYITARAVDRANRNGPLVYWTCIVRANRVMEDSLSPFENFRRAALGAAEGTMVGISRDQYNNCTTINIHKNIAFQRSDLPDTHQGIIHPIYIYPGVFQTYLHTDLAQGSQRFNIKVHPDRLSFITVENANGVESGCSINGNGALAEDIYDSMSYVSDGTQITMYHDRSVDAYNGRCTGFKFVFDTRYMTDR
jgi:hypothetical protein